MSKTKSDSDRMKEAFSRCDDLAREADALREQLATEKKMVSETWVHIKSTVKRAEAAEQQLAAERQRAAKIEARVKVVLRQHWLTEVRCNHDDKTDTAFCSCSTYPGEPANSVQEAVDNWVDHILEAIRDLATEPAGVQDGSHQVLAMGKKAAAPASPAAQSTTKIGGSDGT